MRALRRTSRAARTRRRSRASSPSGRRGTTPARSTASSTRQASSADRSTRWPRSSRTRSSGRARCSSSTSTPSSGRTSGPGIVPKFSATPGEVRWSGHVGGRAATTRRSTAGCSASPTTELRRIARGWRRMSVTICDVGPRDGLQNQPDDARAGGARGARRQAGGGRRASHRGRQLRQPDARAADGGSGGGGRGDRPARWRRVRRPRRERAGLRQAA